MIEPVKELLKSKSFRVTVFALTAVLALSQAANAQGSGLWNELGNNPSNNGAGYLGEQGAYTLRTPLIPCALNAAPNQQPAYSDPPPPGCGPTPWGVTPGMPGDPCPEPWVPRIPANTACGSGTGDSTVNLPLSPPDVTAPGQFNQYVGSSIPNPPSTPGDDPGMFPTKDSGLAPPVALVDITQDGFVGADQAPQQKWGGDATKDFGRNKWVGQNSHLYDLGQRVKDKPDVTNTPVQSEDGPRQFEVAQDPTTATRGPQMTNTYGQAQQTSDFGTRTLFKGARQRAQQTQASY